MKTTDLKTFELGVILLVHAQSADEARRALAACLPCDLRVERSEVQYCEENLARFTLN